MDVSVFNTNAYSSTINQVAYLYTTNSSNNSSVSVSLTYVSIYNKILITDCSDNSITESISAKLKCISLSPKQHLLCCKQII